MPDQLARVGSQPASAGRSRAREWDHEVKAPLLWEDDGQALLFTAEQKGRTHLWRFDRTDRRAEVLVEGGTVLAYDKRAGTVVTMADAADHPARATAHVPGRAPRRIERFNDKLLASLDLGRHEEVWFEGALGDRVQMWLFYPPGFDAKKKYPLLHTIHGGPHTAPGDGWHYRWNNKVFAAQGYVVAAVNYHGSLELRLRVPRLDHPSLGRAGTEGHRGRDRLVAQAALDRLAPRVRRRRQLRRLHGGVDERPREAAAATRPTCATPAASTGSACSPKTPTPGSPRSWAPRTGTTWPRCTAQSPHAFAGTMHTPTLVIHGALDYRVPDAQGLAYYNTLKARGVDARLLWFPDENHWVLKPRNSKLWYGEFFDWLAPARRERAPATAKRSRKAGSLANELRTARATAFYNAATTRSIR